MSEDLNKIITKFNDLDSKYLTCVNNFNNLNLKLSSKISKHDLKSNSIEIKSLLVGTGQTGNFSISEDGQLSLNKKISNTLKSILNINSDGKITNSAGFEVKDSSNNTVASVSDTGKVTSTSGFEVKNSSNVVTASVSNTGDSSYTGSGTFTGLNCYNADFNVGTNDYNGTIVTNASISTDGTAIFSGAITCNASMTNPTPTTLVTRSYVENQIPAADVKTGSVSYNPLLSTVINNYTLILQALSSSATVDLPVPPINEYGRLVTIVNRDSTYATIVKLNNGATNLINQYNGSVAVIEVSPGILLRLISYNGTYRIIYQSLP